MTREQARQNLVTIGIESPTDEQITAFLNQIQSETRFERERADKLKDDAAKAKDLQKQLDDLNNQSLSELDQEKKAREKSDNRVAELEKQLKNMQTMNALAEHGIVGDDAKNLIKEDGTLDFATLGKIISDRETKAASDKEKELLARTPNPDGDKGSGGDDKTEAERLVERMVVPNQAKEATKSVISNYLNNGGN